MTHPRHRLTTLFQSLLALAAAPACSGGLATPQDASDGGVPSTDGGATTPSPDGGIPRAPFDQSPCTGGRYVPLMDVTPTTPVDSLGLLVSFVPEDGGALGPGSPMSTWGTACQRASNVGACAALLAGLRPASGWPLGPGLDARIGERVGYLVYTRGDEVGSVTSLPALAAFLAPLETAHDAALLADASGYTPTCAGNGARKIGEAWEIVGRTGSECSDGSSGPVREHRLRVEPDGKVTVLETVDPKVPQRTCGIGRRPDGLAPPVVAARTAVGDYLARMAHLEAASIPAFERLVDELRAHGAPEDLVVRACAARDDEVRHARATAALARRYGGAVEPPRGFDRGCRSLVEMARENAAEGCVGETFGAVLAAVQAVRAEDVVARRALARIAVDECEHAALSWDVAAWAEGRLTEGERAEVAAARTAAVAALRAELAFEPDADVARALGLPSAALALTMFERVARELWAA